MKDTYIQAVAMLLADNQSIETVLQNLQAVLKNRGHERLYSDILVGVAKELEKKEIDNAVTVAVANQSDISSSAVAAAVKMLDGEGATPRTQVDSTLIGGVKVTYKNRQIDQTYKATLRHLYEQVIT